MCILHLIDDIVLVYIHSCVTWLSWDFVPPVSKPMFYTDRPKIYQKSICPRSHSWWAEGMGFVIWWIARKAKTLSPTKSCLLCGIETKHPITELHPKLFFFFLKKNAFWERISLNCPSWPWTPDLGLPNTWNCRPTQLDSDHESSKTVFLGNYARRDW